MRFKPAPGFFTKKKDTSLVIVSIENDDFYWEIEGQGMFLWNRLQEKEFSASELSQLAAEEFQIDIETAEEAVLEWLEDLCKHQILIKRT